MSRDERGTRGRVGGADRARITTLVGRYTYIIAYITSVVPFRYAGVSTSRVAPAYRLSLSLSLFADASNRSTSTVLPAFFAARMRSRSAIPEVDKSFWGGVFRT